MLQHMMNGPNAKRQEKQRKQMSPLTQLMLPALLLPSAKLATIIEEDDTNTVDVISFGGLVPNI